MKIISILLLAIFLIFNAAYAEEETPSSPALQEEDQSPPPKALSESGNGSLSNETQVNADNEEEKTETPAIPVKKTAEQEKSRGIFNTEITSIFQTVDLDTNSSKAQEYRILKDGFYIKDFYLQYAEEAQELTSALKNIVPLSNIADDGQVDLNFRRYGVIDVNLGLKKFPRDYTNDAESLFTNVNPYTYRIPESPGSAIPFDASTQRDNYALNARLTPGDLLTVTTSLSVENRKGRRPLTMENLTGSAATPTAITEIAEPTDYTIAIIALGLEYSDNIVNMQLDNNIQIFSNTQPDDVIWYNPWQPDAYGRARTADDYTVHSLSFRPSIRLSDEIRLVNSLSYSTVTNSISLAPLTTANIEGDTFQKNIIETDVRSVNFSSTLTTMPSPDIRLNVKYKYYAYENDTPEIEAPPKYILLDGVSTKYSRTPRYTSIITRSLGIDGNWYISDRLSVDAGIEDKDIPRREREVDDQQVDSAFITANSVLSKTLSALIGYKYERVRGSYDTTYYKAVYDPLSEVNQHQLMRAFDLSENDTHTAKTSVNFLPLDILNLSASLSVRTGDHKNVKVGRKRSQSESAFLSAELSPFNDIQIYSHYFYDRTTINSRYSWTYDITFSELYPEDSNPDYAGFIKPVSETIEDTSNSFVIGFDYDVFRKLIITGNYSRNKSSSTSVSMPEVNSTTDTYEFKISYRLRNEAYLRGSSIMRLNDLRISAGYYSETFKRNDYALDNFPDPVDIIDLNNPGDIFLGVREPDYKLNIFSLTLGFYF